jgi:hypothetical protein
MALEDLTGTNKYIANLVNTNPLSADDRREGDDHIRGIKNVLLNTFPGLSAPVNLGSYVAKAGDTMTGSLAVPELRVAPDISYGNNALIYLVAPSSSVGITGIVASRGGAVSAKVRWQMHIPDATAETGANAGSDFGLHRYSDAGVFIDTVLAFKRSTGVASFGGTINFGVWTGAATTAFLSADSGACTFALNGTGTRLEYNKNTLAMYLFTNGTQRCYWDAASGYVITGQGWKPGGGVWADVSDARMKANVQDYTRGLDAVLELRPVTYNFKPETERDTSVRYVGLIAQEAEVPMPELVTSKAQTIGKLTHSDMRSLDSTALTFALINAVKTLHLRVEALELLCAGVGDA